MVNDGTEGTEAPQDIARTGERKRSYVTLAQHTDIPSPSDDEDASIVIGNRVSHKAARRSGLLSGIKDTEGLASLPGRMTPEDVKLWETACAVDVDPCNDELVKILQVADALSDPSDNKWVHKLAERAVATDWQDGAERDAMLAALLHLSPNLLHRVLSFCLDCKSPVGGLQTVCSSIMDTFPPPLHRAIVSAMIARTNILIPAQSTEAILMQLSYAVPPQTGPGLGSITLSFDDSECSQPAAATGALLARAAAAHPSLTRLSLNKRPAPPHLLRTFSSCLPPTALPALVHLSLTAHAHPSGCADVAACLALLPSLEFLSLAFDLTRPACAAEVSLTAYARLAASPAALPSLHTLTISERVDSAATSQDHDSCVHLLLPLLKATALTGMDFQLCPVRTPFHPLAAAMSRERFPALESLCLSATLAPAAVSKTLRALRDTGHEPGQSGPPVDELYIVSRCPSTVPSIAAAVRPCFSTLTHLSMSVDSCLEGKHQDGCRERKAQDAWPPFLSALGSCTALTSLELHCLCTVHPAERDLFSRRLANALQSLIQLTSLELWCDDGEATPERIHAMARTLLSGRMVGEGLSALVNLQFLSMRSGTHALRFDSVVPVLAACGQLPQLRDLQLCCHGVTLGELNEGAARLGAVTCIGLRSEVYEEDVDAWDALVERFPTIRFEI